MAHSKNHTRIVVLLLLGATVAAPLNGCDATNDPGKPSSGGSSAQGSGGAVAGVATGTSRSTSVDATGGLSQGGATGWVDAGGAAGSAGTVVSGMGGQDGFAGVGTVSGRERALRIDGHLLRDPKGAVVRLRGVNLGGWLVTENWMCGITDATDAASGRFTLETLEERFGEAQADVLMGHWRDNFLTTEDLDDIKSLGFNVVRVPFGYRNLQHAGGTWRRDATGAIDFSRMDWLVREAAARDLWVIFDYHVWKGQEQGRTSDGSATGKALAKTAYEYLTCGPDDERRQVERAHAIAVWTEVIEHYRGNGHVAAFELLNECCGATWGTMFLYDALRAVDRERIFLIWGDPKEQIRGWTNVIYGPHQYDVDGPTLTDDQATIDADMAKWSALQQDFHVPYLVGEFHVFTGDSMPSLRYLLNQYATQEFNWTKWTYKAVGVGDWSLVSLDRTHAVDVAHDSFETIAKQWKALRTAPTTLRTELRSALAEAARAP